MFVVDGSLRCVVFLVAVEFGVEEELGSEEDLSTMGFNGVDGRG